MEKKDKLADFMRENRELFDDRAPSPELWDNISRQLNTGSRKRRSLAVNWLSGAAAALVLTLLVPTVWYSTNDGLQSYDTSLSRSEERRVGKECRSRRSRWAWMMHVRVTV